MKPEGKCLFRDVINNKFAKRGEAERIVKLWQASPCLSQTLLNADVDVTQNENHVSNLCDCEENVKRNIRFTFFMKRLWIFNVNDDFGVDCEIYFVWYLCDTLEHTSYLIVIFIDQVLSSCTILWPTQALFWRSAALNTNNAVPRYNDYIRLECKRVAWSSD